ncbi:MAG: NAD(P)H-binding protein [Thermonemataceae bacterium]
MDNIFITAASGNIGAHLVEQLSSTTSNITAGFSQKPTIPLAYSYAVIDYGDMASLVEAFTGMDTVFLLFPAQDALLEWAKNAIEAVKKANVKHVVRSSALGADIHSDYPLLQAHGQIDTWLKESGIRYTITQPASFMQNYVGFLGRSVKQGTVYTSVGEGKNAWIDVRDIAAVNANILQNPSDHTNKTYILTGSEAFSIHEGIGKIGQALHKEINVIDISQEEMNKTLKQYGMSEKAVQYIASFEMATKAGVLSKVTKDVAHILSQKPRSFDAFMAENLDAWR